MFKNILIAYDGSDHAKKAVKIAGDVARSQGEDVMVRIVTVMDPSPSLLGEPYLSHEIEDHARKGQMLIQEAVELIGDVTEPHTDLLFGQAADCILQVAETRGCDLIVMGTRGMGLLEGLLLGSQAQKVISHAHCPVLVVR